MSSAQVCNHFKYGHCRFRALCRHEHVNEISENTECNENTSRKRHPKTCIFFREFKRCKFGTYCHYKHENDVNDVSSQNENKMLLSRIKRLEESIAILTDENEKLIMKLESNEMKVSSLAEVKLIEDGDNNQAVPFATSELEHIPTYTEDCEAIEKNDLLGAHRQLLEPAFASYPS